MKLFEACWVVLVASAVGASKIGLSYSPLPQLRGAPHVTSDNVAVELQGTRLLQRNVGNLIPGWGQPAWGGRSFDDSVANFNPWGRVRNVPVVDDLEPVAPQDRMDKSWVDSATGAAPLEPGRDPTQLPHQSAMPNDFISKYKYPYTFPADTDAFSGDSGDAGSTLTPLEKRTLIASKDKLRPPYAWRSSGNYPLVAPADRSVSSKGKALGWLDGSSGDDPWPVASTETVAQKFSKYFQQVHDREQRRKDALKLDRAFNAADLNGDQQVSRAEYLAEVGDRQNKTEKEAEHLWEHAQIGEVPSLNKQEFRRLWRAGFDLGSIDRNDTTSISSLVGTGPYRGFWGSGAACPASTFVTGARLKVMPPAGAKLDDTGLNGVVFRCSSGADVATIEGPDGRWTDWAECPEGEHVYSVRAKLQPYAPGRDNAALMSLELGCRAPDLSKLSKLRFGGAKPTVIVGAGLSAKGGNVGVGGGGWTKEYLCNARSAVCGAQANVVRDRLAGDNAGMTDMRIYCCENPIDCTKACDPSQGKIATFGCQACRAAAGISVE